MPVLFLSLCYDFCSAVGDNEFISLRNASEDEYKPIRLRIEETAFAKDIKLIQVAETAPYTASSTQPWVKIATGTIRFRDYLPIEEFTSNAIDFEGGPEDSLTVQCVFLTGDDEQFEQERAEEEILDELSSRWRELPREAFGMQEGVRAPENAVSVQCVAYYGRGGINLNLGLHED